MNPTLEIVNGKSAKVQATQHVPLQKVTTYIPTNSEYLPKTETEYVDVVDSLEITPHVFADGYIGLETSIVLGAKNTPDGVKQVPILTKKEIVSKENRIRPGESLIIGGIRKTEKFGVARGVPLLKDIPIIGFLFSGEDTEQRAVETVFILTPTISTNGKPTNEIMAGIKDKHASVSTEDLKDTVGNIFKGQSQKEQQQSANEAEQSQQKTAEEKTEVQAALKQANLRAEKAEAEIEKLKNEMAKMEAQTKEEKARTDEKARAENKAKEDMNKAANDSKKAQAQTNVEDKTAEKDTEEPEAPQDNAQKPTAEENKPETKA